MRNDCKDDCSGCIHDSEDEDYSDCAGCCSYDKWEGGCFKVRDERAL